MTDQHPELVSVVTPCYNAAPFVAETIESVAAQTYAPVEHIVVDDGSTDESWSVIQRAAERQPSEGLRAVRLPGNRGASHARNRGAALARGAYLMFLDADDLITPQTLEGLVRAVRDHPGTVSVCRWLRLRQDVPGGRELAPAEVPFPPPADALYGWLDGVWVPPCAVLWRRDAYARAGGWDESITVNDDGDLMMRALARGVRLRTAASGEAWYRAQGPGWVSLSGLTVTARGLRSRCRVLENVAKEVAQMENPSRYIDRIGVAFHRLGLVALHVGDAELAHQCLRAASRYADRRSLARTWTGRVLLEVLGLERKERVASAAARLGLTTTGRRHLLEGYFSGQRRPAGQGRAPAVPGERHWRGPN
jgi:O-antigen biosynthesis protein